MWSRGSTIRDKRRGAAWGCGEWPRGLPLFPCAIPFFLYQFFNYSIAQMQEHLGQPTREDAQWRKEKKKGGWGQIEAPPFWKKKKNPTILKNITGFLCSLWHGLNTAHTAETRIIRSLSLFFHSSLPSANWTVLLCSENPKGVQRRNRTVGSLDVGHVSRFMCAALSLCSTACDSFKEARSD